MEAAPSAARSLFTDAVRRDPYPHYARLRDSGRVHRLEPPGIWSVARYDDVVTMLRRPDVFSSRVMAAADPVLLGADPPQHDPARAVVRRAFSRSHLERLAARAQAIAADLVEPMVRDERTDVVEALAAPLPIQVLAELLGVGRSHLDAFRRWSRAIVALGTGASEAAGEDPAGDVEELDRFLSNEIERRRRAPQEDLLGALVGDPTARLAPGEVLSAAKLRPVAATETTTSLIANTLVSLLRHPAALDAIRRDHALVPAAIEETLRHESPVQFVYRLARRDTDTLGAPIPAGAIVMAIIGSANRDERRFEAPDAFRLDRPRGGHIAFGLGPHACLGALIARAEARAAVETLLRAAPDLACADDLDDLPWMASVQLRGPTRLRIALRA
jgi:cytochrome P450